MNLAADFLSHAVYQAILRAIAASWRMIAVYHQPFLVLLLLQPPLPFQARVLMSWLKIRAATMAILCYRLLPTTNMLDCSQLQAMRGRIGQMTIPLPLATLKTRSRKYLTSQPCRRRAMRKSKTNSGDMLRYLSTMALFKRIRTLVIRVNCSSPASSPWDYSAI